MGKQIKDFIRLCKNKGGRQRMVIWVGMDRIGLGQ